MATVQAARPADNRHVITGSVQCCGITGLSAEDIQEMLQNGAFGESEETFRNAIHALRSDLVPESKQCSGGCFRLYQSLSVARSNAERPALTVVK